MVGGRKRYSHTITRFESRSTSLRHLSCLSSVPLNQRSMASSKSCCRQHSLYVPAFSRTLRHRVTDLHTLLLRFCTVPSYDLRSILASSLLQEAIRHVLDVANPRFLSPKLRTPLSWLLSLCVSCLLFFFSSFGSCRNHRMSRASIDSLHVHAFRTGSSPQGPFRSRLSHWTPADCGRVK